ncbi:TPA: DEAD/DEAH box helicase [Vibrio cholerae]|uniref:DEAD/DEAH box helicase n=1 Tax=Vibrio cholerae TaxID=666 RepID=UPI001F310EF1|nr:DEAD/DEAH box helicase [Vibrio cholerae]UIP05059.1 DEAD/DEAH box helicase [Vibrio cholerae]HEQ3432716.1 DEAD/DEAH box helicase [Vibrio cholerae]HEQ3493595.1 DEAD/DEAH box helicase [Vibrio cholerae]HEQ3505351.1 DEAD/DEAH box helicase [Vibrio cholerae]HEQ3569883.1 DEAD/DEAH box helicase [Vibrio cholerae]
MLPSVVSDQVASSVKKYVKSAFTMNSPCFESEDYSMIDSFLNERDNLVKGPYLSIQLPFRQSALAVNFFSQVRLPFPPYAHQAVAYQRLGGDNPQATLVATGTGSGKTECFLYPILNHCAASNQPGVKAIVIYPMNALATDQAKRFAETVYNNVGLKGKVTVGLFVGGGDGQGSVVMSKDGVITSKEHLRNNPPDILLTNYKMLDYLLMRPEDQSLWLHNQPGTLKYLVVDELHTFDGAQGSDLACLIRRLKFHLSVDNQGFACVGTSATVGDDLAPLLEYASTIFDAPFDESAVVREDRYRHDEYLQAHQAQVFNSPGYEQLSLLDASQFADEVAYLNQQLALWFPEHNLALPDDLDSDEGRAVRIALGEALLTHQFFHSLLGLLDGKISALDVLVNELDRSLSLGYQATLQLLQSFIALVSIARRGIDESPEAEQERIALGKARPVLPFLQVRYQIWLRELRRLVAKIHPKPVLRFSDDLAFHEGEQHMPVIHCRDCHATGWGSYGDGYSDQLENDLEVFYRLFFARHQGVRVLFPINEGEDIPAKGLIRRVCPTCLTLNSDSAPIHCGHEQDALIRVFIPDLVKTTETKGPHFDNQCPYCHSKNGLSIIGAQSATLSSVAINQLYASRFNDNKKLITFSDSVQDAAHRAGFFAARTWPLMVRGHIATVAQQFEGLDLASFATKVTQEAQAKLVTPESFVATFTAPNMEWLNDYRELVEGNDAATLPAKSNLPDLVAKRLNWEVHSEFGLRAAIGRTLERTGEVSVDVCSDELVALCSKLHAELVDELGNEFSGVNDQHLLHFCLGVLHRMRLKGAINHSALQHYIQDAGETYYLTKIDRLTSKFMPNWSDRTRTPQFLSFGKIKHFDNLFGSKHHHSWYQTWLNKCLGNQHNVMISSHTQTIYSRLMHALRKAGIVAQFDVKGCEVWGLQPESLKLTTNLQAIGCDRCTERLVVAKTAYASWYAQPCHNDCCQGRYTRDLPLAEKEWHFAQTHRVNASEHTGLLERDVREQVENSFIKGQSSWAVNLLSSTPTLEMGIDIGGLSSVLLCSVPPAQANYLQRIGRAGRKDGNAFNMTVAEGNPHDLFYYQEPLEMMAGSVTAPGVYLDASAILERQLTAFCMDRWIKTGVTSSAIPKRVKQMLDATESGQRDIYPYNFLTFVKGKQQELFDLFISIFHSLSPNSVDKLRAFMFGSNVAYSLESKIEQSLSHLATDRKSLRSRAEKLKRSIDKLKLSPVKDLNFESELNELENERNALLALIREINGKNTLNFMTDEGLLPNYAFPEAGVTLRSVLWRKKDTIETEDGSSQYVTRTFEYERPAAAALSELAPTSHFYAGGHKVEIEQIDMKVSEPETWRVCSHCNYSERIEADQHSFCPKCGHSGWGDAEQKIRMLKLRQVYARSSSRDSKIADDADTRTPAFFQRQMLVNFMPQDVAYAYHIPNKEMPFGFEFLNRVTLRDINFGSASDEGEEFYVAGEKKKKTGFKVCSDCGFVQKNYGQPTHEIACKYRNSPEEARYEDVLYLYRELESEAIRILLPVSNYGLGEVTESSLAAALQLGMKKYFKGSVDHLKGTIYKEPADAGESYRYYLVIYDSVPGGTGALKELMQEPDNLIALLSMALEVIEHCACASEGKDGCYHCVYAYRDRNKMRSISREHARKLLRAIIDNKDKLISIKSVSDIEIDGVVESELERLFIETLKGLAKEFVVTKEFFHNRSSWFIASKINSDVSWHLVPQVELGANDGVYIETCPDFVLYPASQMAGVKPLAIYLDGFAFHKKIVFDDVAKRNAVRDSGRYNTWTLGWHDIVQSDKSKLKEFFGLHRQEIQPKEALYPKFIERNYQTLRSVYEGENNFSLLKKWLHQPIETSVFFRQASTANCFYWLAFNKSRDLSVKAKFEYEMRENSPASRFSELCMDTPYLFGGLLDSVGTSQRLVEIATVFPVESYAYVLKDAVKGQTPFEYVEANIRLHICFDDRDIHDEHFEAYLAGFWKLVNIGQFMRDFSCTSRVLLQDDVNDGTLMPNQTASVTVNSPSSVGGADEEWQLIIEHQLLEPEVIEAMMAKSLSAPEVGYELASEEGEILAEAELAWPSSQVALLLPEQQEAVDLFESKGWFVIVGALNETVFEQLNLKLKHNDR